MSLILDALNRSREDRDAVPGIGAQHGSSTERPARWRQGLPWIALGFACLLIAWLLLERGANDWPAPGLPPASENDERRQEPLSQSLNRATARAGGSDSAISAAEDSQPAPAVAAGAGAASLAPEKRPVAAAPKVVATGTAPSPEVAALYATDKPRDTSAQAPSRAATAATQQSRASTDPETAPVAGDNRSVTVADSAMAAAAAGSSEDEPIDVEKVLQQARASAADARLVEHPVPFLATLSQQAKDEIPTVFYQRHDYSERSPSVVLNGKTLRVGGAPAAGMKVREILPDSVILEHRGVKFRLRALNSWVNL
ncbi:MAG: hypothetical protein Hals2KO_06900 [Halioglobus sp.]